MASQLNSELKKKISEGGPESVWHLLPKLALVKSSRFNRLLSKGLFRAQPDCISVTNLGRLETEKLAGHPMIRRMGASGPAVKNFPFLISFSTWNLEMSISVQYSHQRVPEEQANLFISKFQDLILGALDLP